MSPETLTLLGLVIVVVIVVAGGLALSLAQRRGRDEATLRGLGFARGAGDGRLVARWQGRELAIEVAPKAPLRVSTALTVAPLPHEVLARALGRGDVLARLYQLEARAETDALIAHLPLGLRARGLRVLIDEVVTLADLLEAMPRHEAMARWYLDTAGAEGGPHVDRAEALEKLIAAFPDAAETLAVCRSEVETASDPRAAELARRHLERGSGAPKTS